MAISVIGPEPSRRDALDRVRATFDALHATVRDLGEEELIPVPGHPDAPMLNYRHMRSLDWQGFREYPAPGIQAGDVITVKVSEALSGVRGEERQRQDEALRQITVLGDYNEGGKHMRDDRSIKAGRDIKNSQVGQTLTNCTNLIQQQAPGEKKTLLLQLDRDVRLLLERLPDEKQEEVEADFKMLVEQVTSERPNRKWYSVSAEGLLEASKWTKDFAGNIAGTVGQLGRVFWPDFSLPGAPVK